MAYADNITITSTHTSTSAAKKYIQPYLHEVFCLDKTKQPLTKSRQNNLHSVHTRPCRIYEQSGPRNKQQSTTHGNAPKGSGSYRRPKTHIQHTHPQHLSTSTQTSTNHKSLTATGWGKHKETLRATYKAVMRPALEYTSSVRSSFATSTGINKLQVMQNAALRIATGCTQDTNIQICMTKHSHSPYTSTYCSTPHNTENTTSITSPTQTHNILQHSKA